MFAFARKKGLIPQASASVEHAVQIDTADLYCSQGATTLIRSGILNTLVRCLAKTLVLKGEKKEVITDKVGALITAAVTAGDLTKDSASWIRDSDWYSDNEEWISYNRPSDTVYGYFYDLVNSAMCEKSFVADCMEEARKQLTEEELTLLENYEKKSKEFYEARKLRDQYFRKAATRQVHDIVAQYSNIISNIDIDFYNTVAAMANVDNVAQTDAGVSGTEQNPPEP